jgi:Nif-specific regulatory protein
MVVPIADDQVSLGQSEANTLCLVDPSVSPNHCTIGKRDGAYELIDLNSDNGTFVNGVPIRRKQLSDGDTIRIGNSELRFAVSDRDSVDGYDLDASTPASLPRVKTIPVDRAALDTNFDNVVGRMARDLAAMLRISRTISIRDAEQLQREILRLIFEVVPAEKGAIVLLPPSKEQTASIYGWSREGGDSRSIDVQSEIVHKVLWEGSAAITDTEQQADGDVHVLCVPLVAVRRALGVLYLTSSQSESPFLDDQVDFLMSASRFAAVALENILAMDALNSENRQLKEQMFYSKFVGESRAIRKVETFVSRVAGQDVTVLIRGESGTGKELVARSIHHDSPRAERPFVAINCAAIPEALLESELFGHEKGAFTGAASVKKDKLEAVEDGTLFLDEIGELAPLLQAKLLRALQQREFERLGGNRAIKFCARVVTATNKDLEKAIKCGEFRQDLYYRLNVVSVTVPPLRERREDIPLLALYFANKYAATCKRPFKGMSPKARTMLINYSWPGNVRELENAIEHAIVLGVSDEILPEDLPAALLEEQAPQVEGSRYHAVINDTKKNLIREALKNSSGSFPEAAKSLGVHPKYLFRLVRNLNLKSDLS